MYKGKVEDAERTWSELARNVVERQEREVWGPFSRSFFYTSLMLFPNSAQKEELYYRVLFLNLLMFIPEFAHKIVLFALFMTLISYL